jgi:hypothetical protein
MSARHRQAKEVPLNIHLHERQFIAFTSVANEILYGGAAGGGKSFLMRCAAVIWCAAISGLQIYLFRREHNDLIKNHMEGPKGFRNLLAPWEQAGLVKIVEDEIRFWNGSKIYLCHCQHEKHRFKYHGAEIHVLLMDELTHFSEVIYRYLRNRVRMVGIDVPAQYAGMFPRILCSSNPGNIGHGWVKATFVDNADDLAIRQMSKSEGGMRRQFIRARLEDNPSMMEDDPTYEDRLEGLGSAELVKAMRWGDWDVIEGAFFDNFDAKRHVLRPVGLPNHWLKFRAGDWGSAKPFSIGWYSVASDDWLHPDGFVIPRGGMIKYREWYGVKTNPDGTFQADVGVKLTSLQVAQGILEREGALFDDRGLMVSGPTEAIEYGVLDPAAFHVVSGPSIAEEMSMKGVYFMEADNKRVPLRGAIGGWDQVRARLNGDGDGKPMLFFFSNCKHTIRTLPALQHDPNRPEDVMTDSEDHAGDETRYACMSRPWIPPQKNAQIDSLSDYTNSHEREPDEWRVI